MSTRTLADAMKHAARLRQELLTRSNQSVKDSDLVLLANHSNKLARAIAKMKAQGQPAIGAKPGNNN